MTQKLIISTPKIAHFAVRGSELLAIGKSKLFNHDLKINPDSSPFTNLILGRSSPITKDHKRSQMTDIKEASSFPNRSVRNVRFFLGISVRYISQNL